jgi:hypothetical protein
MFQLRNIPLSRINVVVLLLFMIYLNLLFGVVKADGELIANGGFESGSFSDWQTTGICEVRPHRVHERVRGQYWHEPAHSGGYSARLGGEDDWGGVSQTVLIPECSEAYVSFWYRVEKGCILDVTISTPRGEVTKWRFTDETDWREVTYHLDPSYAGSPVTIDFRGKGHKTTEYIEIPVTVWTDIGPMVIYERRSSVSLSWPYIDDVSVEWRKALYKVTVSISGLPGDLSSTLKVDGGSSASQVKGGGSETLTFNVGTSHEISVEEYIYQGDSIRYRCEGFSAEASTDTNLEFTYVRQYLLKVSSPYSSVEGEGWYYEGSTARFRVSDTQVPVEGLQGSLGVKYTFKGWIGDAKAETPEGEVLMDSPKLVEAVWVKDYSSLYLPVIGLAALVGAVLSSVIYLHRGKGGRGLEEGPTIVGYGEVGEETIPGGEFETLPGGEVKCPKCGMINAPGSPLCSRCGFRFETGTEVYGEEETEEGPADS